MSLQAEIKKHFSGFDLEVSLHTDQGILGILGASGSGKSMTLKCIAGIETPDEGRIVLNGRVLFDSEKRINLPPQKRKVGYLFQNYALFPNMTVEENIAAGLTGSRKEKQEVTERMLRLFKLENLEKRYPSQLSGGQMQRVALARILAYEPDVIMLDEPFSALDYYLKEQLQLQVKAVLDAYKGDVLLVTHSRDEVYRFCEKSMILERGRVVSFGSTKGIFKRPDHVTAARLTGCKNLSRIRRLGPHQVMALDWGISLTTKDAVGDEIEYIGIRAHDFYLADRAPDERGKGSAAQSASLREPEPENRFACRLTEELEQPFEKDILLMPCSDQEKERIWWKMNPDRYCQLDGFSVGDILQVGVRPEDILLLKA